MNTRTTRASTRRKVFALAAGGAALGLGVTATLAAWTDTEWVFGGDGTGGPGVGTSTFSVEQNTVAPFTADDWVNEPANPGGEIVFGPDAIDLTPGDSVYAAVALRAAPDSIAGTVELQAAVPAAGIAVDDPAGLLFDALQVRVAASETAFTCDATAFDAGSTADLIADGPLASTGASATQALDAAAGNTQIYCFEISLPDPLTLAPGTTIDDYMGLTAAPAWEFQAES